MINTFWNICSTCPMPKEEKLNSEYKRNYVWHPIYRAVPQEVVCVPPQAVVAKEMGIQRKKQYPDLAYRTSEVIGTSTVHFKDVVDSRTRSEERDYGLSSKSGTRSRSADPGTHRQQANLLMAQSFPPQTSEQGTLMPRIGELPSLAEGVQKNTECRSQYAWPRHSGGKICTARKSISMGLIRAPDQPDLSALSKPRDTLGAYQKLPTQEEDPEITREKSLQDLKKKMKTEYKAKYKPFTSYVYIDGQWKKTSRLIKVPEHNTSVVDCHPWYSEVMERLQKANEYKSRGHGHQYGEKATVVHSKRGETTPVVQLKKDVPEVHVPPTLPEAKKKERQKRPEKKLPEKKEKEAKPEHSRPKSADPGRSRKPKPQQRPRTAPPPAKESHSTPAPAHLAYARKSTPKGSSTEGRTKSLSRPPTARKTREDSSKTGLPSDGRASRTSHHPPATSSSGKVWLQSGAQAGPPPGPRDAGESFKGKHSDAVGPSTLLPPKPKSPPPVGDQESATFQPIKPSAADALGPNVKVNPSPVPLTHVQTPEEVTGVKSPEPENWTVPIDKGKKLQWTDSSAHETLLTQGKAASSPKAEPSEKVESNIPSEPTDVPAPPDSGAQKAANPSPSKMTTADVLDRARSRLDQFWGKK